MLVTIDESGDPGFKKNSSSHYVLGMVIFDTFRDAENTAIAIKKIKKKLNLTREFHFSQCNNRFRDAFFESIKHCNFSVRIFSVEKRLIYNHNLQNDNILFTNFCLRHFIGEQNNGLNNAHVKIDGSGSRIFKYTFTTYVRKEVDNKKFKKIDFVDSKSNVLIQMVDMVVGAYSRPYNSPNKKDSYRWKNMIDSKITNIWNFR